MKKFLFRLCVVALFISTLIYFSRASTTSPNISLTIPSVGDVSWGSMLNSSFSVLDSQFGAVTGHDHTGTTGKSPKISLTTAVTGSLPVANGGTSGTSAATARSGLSISPAFSITDGTTTIASGTLNNLTVSPGRITDNGSGLVAANLNDAQTLITHVGGPDFFRISPGTGGACYPMAAGQIEITDGDGTFQEALGQDPNIIFGWSSTEPSTTIARAGTLYCGLTVKRTSGTSAVHLRVFVNNVDAGLYLSGIDCTTANATTTDYCYSTGSASLVAGDRVCARISQLLTATVEQLSLVCEFYPS